MRTAKKDKPIWTQEDEDNYKATKCRYGSTYDPQTTGCAWVFILPIAVALASSALALINFA